MYEPMIPYKGLRGTLERAIVSDARIDRQIDQLSEQNPRIIPVTDRPSRLGDELVLDYAGFSDGAQFEGGTAQNQTLTLGSGSFIPGFEEQLVGKNVGDAVDVHVTFPAQYHAPNLAGKDAVFTTTINYISEKEDAKLTDDFVKQNLTTAHGFTSATDMKKQIRENLEKNKENDYVWNYLMENSKFKDIPEEIVNARVDVVMEGLK